MKRCSEFSLCAALLASMAVTSIQADDIPIDLQYSANAGTWELYAEVTGSGGEDGRTGISTVRALIDGIDFGTPVLRRL